MTSLAHARLLVISTRSAPPGPTRGPLLGSLLGSQRSQYRIASQGAVKTYSSTVAAVGAPFSRAIHVHLILKLPLITTKDPGGFQDEAEQHEETLNLKEQTLTKPAPP